MKITSTRPQDGVALISINRPEVKNALDPEAFRALVNEWIKVEHDDAIRVAVVTGSGDSFCAGADLKALGAADSPPPDLETNTAALLQHSAPMKPLIAAVNGYCIGGGLALALGCDIRIACPEASFSMPTVKLKIHAPGSTESLLMSRASNGVATSMILTGERIDGAAALAAGLVSALVSHDAVVATALEMAATIATFDPLTVRTLLKVVRGHVTWPGPGV